MIFGISSSMGQPSVQYRQAVQGTQLSMESATSRRRAFSSSSRGFGASKVSTFSLICSRVVMPESTTATSGRFWSQRRAQRAALSPGRRAWSFASCSSGRFASRPPRTPSMTTTLRPCLAMASYLPLASWSFQSR